MAKLTFYTWTFSPLVVIVDELFGGDLKALHHPLGQRLSDSYTEGIPELYFCVQQNQFLNVSCDLTITMIAEIKQLSEKNEVKKELKNKTKQKQDCYFFGRHLPCFH